MTKYEIFDYNKKKKKKEGYSVNDILPTKKKIYTDTSK